MTLHQALDRIHALLESDTETPMDGPDYLLRVALCNDAQEEWAEQSDIKWRELYQLDTSQTGDGTTTRFPLPQDFAALNGEVLLHNPIDGAYERIIPIHTAQASQYATRGSQPNRCYIAGTELVFVMPPAAGLEVHIPYYARPVELTNNNQTLPMSKPRYVVYYVVARLTEQSGDYTRYNTNMAKAEELMKQMKIENERLGEGVADTIPLTGYGFGV